jgi:molybdate transport system substrate-binding protein
MKVLASNGVKAALTDLVPAFERSTGRACTIVWASTQMLLEKIAHGERGDFAILTDEAIDDLIRGGLLAAGSRVDLARSLIAVAVRAGATKPDISTAAAFKAALLAARSIAYSRTGISGLYFPTVLDRLGIAEAVRGKVILPPTGVPVGEVVARGEAELAIQQTSELMPVAGIEIVGPFPPDLQKVSVFSAGLFAGAADTEGARALLAALTAPAARPIYARKGMEPAF